MSLANTGREDGAIAKNTKTEKRQNRKSDVARSRGRRGFPIIAFSAMKLIRPRFYFLFIMLGLLAGVLALSACSPQAYRENADDVAYPLIAKAQEAGLGRREYFTIEEPEDTLRKRLDICSRH